jgi:hypothetical protein
VMYGIVYYARQNLISIVLKYAMHHTIMINTQSWSIYASQAGGLV